jgi:hypothetical protein
MENMSDNEFDLMDELYFVVSYDVIKEALNWENELLNQTLYSLHQKDYLKILKTHDQEFSQSISDFENFNWEDKFYVASKKGLLLHNGF